MSSNIRINEYLLPGGVLSGVLDMTPKCTTFAFESYGLRIGVELFDPATLEHVQICLPPDWKEATADDVHRRYRLVDKGPDELLRFGWTLGDDHLSFIGGANTFDTMLEALEADIQIHVAEFAIPHLFLHAGVVEWQGRAIVLPGSSFAGKSTLVTSLVQAGATYYSDEYAVFDGEGRVLPYSRRVSLREGPHGPAGRRDFSHRAPAREEPHIPLPVGLVAILRYDAASGWRIRELDSACAILAMCEHAVPIQRRPAETLSVLAKVVKSAPVIQGTRGDVDDAIERLLLSLESGRGG